MAKCLVIGADGFLGSHIISKLLAINHQVVAFDRFPDGKSRNLDEPRQNLTIFQGDFLNRHDLEAAISGVDYVFHFISTTNPASSSLDPLIDVDTNIRMSIELTQVCVDSGVKKLIYPSTGGAIYGRHSKKPFTEDDRTDPISPYAIGKQTVEGFLRYFKQTHHLEYVVYRISNPYGERQNVIGSQGVIPIFLNLIKQGKPLNVFGDGSMVRDYIYVDDVVDMVVATFEKANKHSIYNLGSGRATSVNELIEKLRDITGYKISVRQLPVRLTDVETVLLDVSRFQKEFGLHASTTLDRGIQKTWEYVKGLPG